MPEELYGPQGERMTWEVLSRGTGSAIGEPPGNRHGDSGDRRETTLHLLSNELARVSTENQSSWTVFASLLGVTLVAGGGFIALDGKEAATAWIWAVLALLPVLVLAYVVAMFSQQVMRSYYARGIERRIMHLGGGSSGGRAPVAQALESYSAVLVGNRRGFAELRFINWLEYALITTVFIGASTFAVFHVDPWGFQLATAVVVAVVVVASALAARRAIVRGPEAYEEAMETLAVELDMEFPIPRAERSSRRLISYLLLPRRNEFLVKSVMLHLTSALLGVWLARDSIGWGDGVRSAALSFVAFEYLLYQARYMVNDYRGRFDDPNSPSVDARGRLPALDSGPGLTDEQAKVRRGAFFVALGGRTVAALLLPVVLPRPLALALLAAMATCMVAGALYERLRREAPLLAGHALTARYVGIYVLIGTSYAARVVAGVHLGSGGDASGALLVSLGAAFYALGTATVLMGWALEATEYVIEVGDGARSRWAIAPEIGSKGHLLPLARLAGALPATVALHSPPPDEPSAAHPRPLQNKAILRDSTSFRAPWNVLVVVASTAAAVAGCVGTGTERVWWFSFAFAGAAIGGAAVVMPRTTSVVVGGLLAANIAVAQVVDQGTLAFLAVPVATVVATYSSVRFMTYGDTIGFYDMLRRLPGRLWNGSGVVLRALWT